MTNQRVLIATTLGVLLAGGLVLAASESTSRARPQKAGYSTDLNALRAKFNADKGKVRLLMLLSPT
jgi:hypothetical protein